MKRSIGLAVLAVFPFIAGCAQVYRPGLPPDPFAESAAPRKDPAYKNLTVALLVSKKTENAMDYLRADEAHLGNIAMDGIINSFAATLRGEFRGLAKVKTVEEAAGINTDLVAVLDLTFRLPGAGSNEVKTAASVTFWTMGKKQADVAKGEAVAQPSGLDGEKGALVTSVREARRRLDEAVASSEKLAALNRAKEGVAGRPAAAQAPAAAIIDSDVDKPGYESQQNADDFAVVIGIDKYSALPAARFAERDAAAVRVHLVAMGYPPRNIAYLTGSQASRASIVKEVEAWLPEVVDENSRVFFYFSGHGAPDTKSGLAYLVPWDGDAKFLDVTAYRLETLYRHLNALKAKQVIVAMDSCFSGAGGRSVLAEGARPLVTQVDDGTRDLGSSLGKLVVFAASAADEITGTLDDQGHGLFTYYFLKGLERSSGGATAKSLYDYLLPNVRDGARRDNRDQSPKILPADLGPKASFALR